MERQARGILDSCGFFPQKIALPLRCTQQHLRCGLRGVECFSLRGVGACVQGLEVSGLRRWFGKYKILNVYTMVPI